MVVHLVQTKKKETGQVKDLGGLEFRAGVTLIANIDGHVRYVIGKPFNAAREQLLQAWVESFDEERNAGWPLKSRDADRLVQAYSTRAMDSRRWR